MRAKFYAFDAQGNQQRPNITDLSITENGIPRTITNVSCPAVKPPIAISSVLVMDVSGSMRYFVDTISNMEISKAGAVNWVNLIPLNPSECAIVSFDHLNYLNQDFTTDKVKLLKAINTLTPVGGTDFDVALINAMSGGLLVSKNGKHQKVIVFFTDGYSTVSKKDEIIKEAINQNCSIYCIALGTGSPNEIKEIAIKTGGIFFENASSLNEVLNLYKTILRIAQKYDPCIIEWQSDVACKSTNNKVELSYQNVKNYVYYQSPSSSIANLEFNPQFHIFENPTIGITDTKQIAVTARNSEFIVTNIVSSNPTFTVSPQNFTILPNQTINVSISHTPTDSSPYIFSKFDFENNVCTKNFFASSGFKGDTNFMNTLKLTHPDGGEKFVVGSDTNIKWEGIAEHELVRLSYSKDNGNTWNYIDTSRGHTYNWQNISKPTSNECLVKVQQLYTSIFSENPNDTVKRLKSHTGLGGVNSVDYSQNGKFLASGSDDGTIKIWEVPSGKLLHTLSAHLNGVNSVCFSPDGKLLASGGNDSTIKIWDITNFDVLSTLTIHNDEVQSVVFSPDGKHLTSGSLDKTIKVCDVATFTDIRTITTEDFSSRNIVFSPDGNLLASGSTNKTIKIWRFSDGSLIHSMTGHSDIVNCVAFSHDGTFIASGSNDKTIKLWDVLSGIEIKTLAWHGGEVFSVAFSPDGNSVASAGRGNRIRIWDLISGNLVKILAEIRYNLLSIEFSPDGSTISSGSDDNLGRIWKLKDPVLQEDQSDSVFAIVEPMGTSQDIDMREVLIGNSKDSVVVELVRNVGTWNFDVRSVSFRGADDGAFSLVSGLPEYRVEPNSSHFGEFRFTPSRVGLHQAEVVIVTQSDTIVQNITGIGVENSILVQSDIIDFGTVMVGKYKDTLQTVTIKNTGSVPITIIETKHNVPNVIDFSTLQGGGSFTLLPNEERLMDLRFKPTDVGKTSGMLEFHYNGIGSPTRIQLFGEGVLKNSVLGSTVAYFSSLLCESVRSSFIELSNNSEIDLIISDILLSGVDATDFEITTTLPITIQKDSSIIIPITFKPQTFGIKNAFVEIHNSLAPDSILIVPISGRKESVALQTIPEIDLGILCPNESKTFEIPISNIGSIQTYVLLTTDSELQISNSNLILAIDSTETVSAVFTGLSQEGTFTRIINLMDSCGAIHTITVKGIIETPQLLVDDIVATTTIGTSETISIEIINNSDRNVSIFGVQGIAPPLSISTNQFPLVVNANSSAFLEVVFTPLNKDVYNQSISIIGEPCTFTSTISFQGEGTIGDITLIIPNSEGYPGDEVAIPIQLIRNDNFVLSGITSLNTEILFNPTILMPKEHPLERIDDTLAKISINNILLNENQNPTIYEMLFHVGLGNKSHSNVSFGKVELVGGTTTQISKINGIFALLGLCLEGGTRLIHSSTPLSLLSVSPNPSDGNVTIDINLIEDGVSALKIFNSNGFLMEKMNFTTSGSRTIELETKNFSNGLYFITIETPTLFDKAKLMLVK